MRAITLNAGLKKGYALGEAIKFLEKISEEKFKREILKLILKDKVRNIKNRRTICFLIYCFFVIYLSSSVYAV